jgi:hypothetical protein
MTTLTIWWRVLSIGMGLGSEKMTTQYKWLPEQPTIEMLDAVFALEEPNTLREYEAMWQAAPKREPLSDDIKMLLSDCLFMLENIHDHKELEAMRKRLRNAIGIEQMTQQNNIKYHYWLVIYQPAYPSFGSDDGEKYICNKASRRIWRTTTPFLTKNDCASFEN